jgi:hypothetical protein
MSRDGLSGSKAGGAGGLQRGSADPRPPQDHRQTTMPAGSRRYRRLPRGVQVMGVAAGVAVAGVAAFLLLAGHFVTKSTAETGDLAGGVPGPSSPSNAVAPRSLDSIPSARHPLPEGTNNGPDPAIVAIAGKYDMGQGWVIEITATVGGKAAITAKRDGRAIRVRSDRETAARCPGGTVAYFIDLGTRIDVYIGTGFADRIVASPDASRCLMFGQGGDDDLTATAGNDTISPGEGLISLMALGARTRSFRTLTGSLT